MGDYDTESTGLPLTTLLAIGSLLFLYIFVLQPLLAWADENPLLFMAMFGITVILLCFFVISYLAIKLREGAGRPGGPDVGGVMYKPSEPSGITGLFSALKPPLVSGSARKHRGFHTYYPTGIEKKVNESEKEASNEKASFSLPDEVAETIRKFKPPENYGGASGYGLALMEKLKKAFPPLAIEMHLDNSHPMLNVEEIAIELLTHYEALHPDALLEKCQKYSPKYRFLIAIILEPRFGEDKYEKTLSGLEKEFDSLAIVLKYT